MGQNLLLYIDREPTSHIPAKRIQPRLKRSKENCRKSNKDIKNF